MKKYSLLIIAVTALFLINCAYENTVISTDLDLIQEKTFSTSQGEELTVSVMGGDIKVKTWSKNEVLVKAYGDDDAKEKLDFIIEKTSSGVRVKTQKKDDSERNFSGVETYFEITIPEKYNADLETAGGDIEVTNLTGNADFKSAGGDITAVSLNGKLEISTAGGDITVKEHTGKKELKTAGGEINVTNSEGDIDAASAGGSLQLNVSNGKVEAASAGGPVTVEYEGENKGIELSSTGGPVTLIVADDFKADIEMGTTGGSIDCDFELSSMEVKKNRKLEGAINGGGKKVELFSTGGPVKLHKK